MKTARNLILVLSASPRAFAGVSAFHDCIEASRAGRERRRRQFVKAGIHQHKVPTESDPIASTSSNTGSSCSGGLCLGMKNGPHEGGNASYPISWDKHLLRGITIRSTMTVPPLPSLTDGITFYIWTDAFFGDGGLGRMNQLVPQLILGKALDGSSGPPNWQPKWGPHHETWLFGSHYFFETFNTTTNAIDSHAAYGMLFPTVAGETLWTEFRLEGGGDGYDAEAPRWVLQMGVEGDPDRISTLVVDRPYMGIGQDPSWGPNKTHSWAEDYYHNICINACWELYGADDSRHLPQTGSRYNITIKQPKPGSFAFLSKWEQDEGKVNGCPSSTVHERHNSSVQTIGWDISVSQPLIPSAERQWDEWKRHSPHAMSDSITENKRRRIFEENLLRFRNRGDEYILDKFAVYTKDEFRQYGKRSCSHYLPSNNGGAMNSVGETIGVHDVSKFSCQVLGALGSKLKWPDLKNPVTIDYRGTQATPVKNQGAFGTCWSFGYVETLEGLGVRQGHALKNVSNQEVIDCCPPCRGAAQDSSFDFVIHNHHTHGRLSREDAYPYRGSPGNCSSASVKSHNLAPAKVGGCIRVYDDTEKTGQPILFALSILGPAAFGIDASCLQGYKGGIITNCTDSQINHEVLLVGAGVDEESGTPFFLAKNSWSNRWGESGYFRFAQRGGQLGFGSVVFASSGSVSQEILSVA